LTFTTTSPVRGNEHGQEQTESYRDRIGRRKRDTAVPPYDGSLEAGGTVRRKIPSGRHPDLQLHINSGILKIYILTQFNSASLHNHIANTYVFDTFSNGFVEILAAEQTYHSETMVPRHRRCGTQEPQAIPDQQADYYIILSGDQLYRMDFEEMLKKCISKAERN
jgi:hypothetical protein